MRRQFIAKFYNRKFIPPALRGIIPSISESSEQNGISLCGNDFVATKREDNKTRINMLLQKEPIWDCFECNGTIIKVTKCGKTSLKGPKA